MPQPLAVTEPHYLLDASAALALIFQEPGADYVAAVLGEARISSVNLAEVVAKQYDRDVSSRYIALNLAALEVEVVPFDRRMALRAGELRSVTREFGLSLGDRSCLATAEVLDLTVLTADRAWLELDLGIRTELIR